MDTISRENNSMLPVGGIIVGVLGLILGGIALVSLQGAKKQLAEQQTKLESIESAASSAASTAGQAAEKAEKASRNVGVLQGETQNAVNEISKMLSDHAARILKVEDGMKKGPVAGGGKKSGEPVTAGPGEYIVKAGDVSGAKIARDHGVSLADLQAVNPGVNWNRLRIGDKLKLPSSAKK